MDTSPGLLTEIECNSLVLNCFLVSDTRGWVDTAPTILDLLGLPSPAAYQGRSLLDDQPGMALFFTDYSLGYLGLRDGRWKLIHEVDSGRSKLFDMQEDPTETIDLSRQRPEQVFVYRQRLLHWCGAQREWIARSN